VLFGHIPTSLRSREFPAVDTVPLLPHLPPPPFSELASHDFGGGVAYFNSKRNHFSLTFSTLSIIEILILYTSFLHDQNTGLENLALYQDIISLLEVFFGMLEA